MHILVDPDTGLGEGDAAAPHSEIVFSLLAISEQQVRSRLQLLDSTARSIFVPK